MGIDDLDLKREAAHCRRLRIVEEADDLGACREQREITLASIPRR